MQKFCKFFGNPILQTHKISTFIGPTTKCYTFLESSHDPWLRSNLICKILQIFLQPYFANNQVKVQSQVKVKAKSKSKVKSKSTSFREKSTSLYFFQEEFHSFQEEVHFFQVKSLFAWLSRLQSSLNLCFPKINLWFKDIAFMSWQMPFLLNIFAKQLLWFLQYK